MVDYKQRCEELEQQLEDSQVDYENRIHELISALQLVEEQKKKLETDLLDLDKHDRRTETSHSSPAPTERKDEESAALHELLDTLKKENEKLKEDVRLAQQANADHAASHKTELDARSSKVVEIEELLKGLQKEVVDKEALINEGLEEIKRFKEKEASLIKERDDMAKEMQEKEEDAKKCVEISNALAEELENLQKQLAEAIEKKNLASNSLAKLEGDLKAAEGSSSSGMSALREENSGLLIQLEDKTKALKTLEQELKTIKESQLKYDELASQISGLENAVKEKQARIEHLTDALMQEQKSGLDVQRSIQQMMSDKDNALKVALGNLAESEHKLQKVEAALATSNTEREEQAKELHELHTKLERLVQDKENEIVATKTNAGRVLQEKENELLAEKQTKEQLIREKEEEVKSVRRASQQLDDMLQAREAEVRQRSQSEHELQESLSNLQKDLAATQEDLLREKTKVGNLENELISLKENLERERGLTQNLERDFDKMQKQYEAERKLAQGLSADIAAIEQKYEAERNLNQSSGRDLASIEARYEAERALVEDLRRELGKCADELKGYADSQAKEIAKDIALELEWHAKLAASQFENNQLRNSIEELDRKTHNTSTESALYHEKVHALESKCATLEKINNQIKGDSETLRGQLEREVGSSIEAKERCNTLSRQVQESQRECQELRDELSEQRKSQTTNSSNTLTMSLNLAQQREDLEKEILKLRDEIRELHSASVVQQSENIRLVGDVQQLREDNQTLYTQVERLLKYTNELNEMNNMCKKKLADYQKWVETVSTTNVIRQAQTPQRQEGGSLSMYITK